MAFSDGFSYLKNIFVETTIFNIEWFISLFLVFLTMIIITRETQKWKQLAFPVTVAWHIAGVTPSFLWYFATAIAFVIDILSLEVLGNTISTITGTAKRITGIEHKRQIQTAEKEVKKEFESAIKKARQKEFKDIISDGMGISSQWINQQARDAVTRASGTRRGITFHASKDAKKAGKSLSGARKRLEEQIRKMLRSKR